MRLLNFQNFTIKYFKKLIVYTKNRVKLQNTQIELLTHPAGMPDLKNHWNTD